MLEHGFWASERLLAGRSRRTIQPVIVNFCTHPFASVPRRPYRTTGILLVFRALPTSDRFSNIGGPPAEDIPKGAVDHLRRVGVEVVLDARCQRALWSEQGDLDVVRAHACRVQGTLLNQYWV